MNKNNGGPAFPRTFSKAGDYSDSTKYPAQDGMTLRDYFAAQAMQELLSFFLPEAESKEVAKYAYAMADAMLAERDK